MPFVESHGERVHYRVEGSGPLVVLLHGMLVDGSSWGASGFVEVLRHHYRVATVDSLGHGLSSRPVDLACYSQRRRADHLAAILDDLEVERAHVVGHSMGGWLAVGMAKHHPERLASLVVAGWNIVEGNRSLLPAGAAPFPFDRFLAWARSAAPALTAWITPADEPALQACWDALQELDGAEAAVLMCRAPTALWSGREDAYFNWMQAFAGRHDLPFLSTPGDHMGAILQHGPEAARHVGDFLAGTQN
ncbi:MAG: alpha/beta fold hydrolase [Caulobacteraceae bacterium]|nr:alpha/beta fold hydrolase [Caulobacter sp.]